MVLSALSRGAGDVETLWVMPQLSARLPGSLQIEQRMIARWRGLPLVDSFASTDP
jgi:hypothetical protein